MGVTIEGQRVGSNHSLAEYEHDYATEYAQTGTLPGWFRETVGATAGDSREGASNGE